MRGFVPSDYLSDLIKERRKQLKLSDPWVLLPIPCVFGVGEGGGDRFLSIGMELYLDSVLIHIDVPLTAVESGERWRDADSKISVNLRIVQPLTPLGVGPFSAIGESIVINQSLPSDEPDIRFLDVRGTGFVIDPLRPLLCRLRVYHLGGLLISLNPKARICVTSLFAVRGKEVAKDEGKRPGPNG